METIPLTDPDDKIRGYMCPTCKGVHTGAGLVCAAKGEDLETARLQLAIEQADECCRCRKCKGKTNPKELHCTTSIGRFGCCKKCGDEVAKESKIRRRRYKVSEKAFNAEYKRRAALAKDWDVACLLVGTIRDHSENLFCAGWSGGIEFDLWQQMLEGGSDPTKDDLILFRITKKQAATLQRLRRRCGGWWMWWTEPKGCKGEHATGEVFVPISEWKKIYAAHAAKTAETTG